MASNCSRSSFCTSFGLNHLKILTDELGEKIGTDESSKMVRLIEQVLPSSRYGLHALDQNFPARNYLYGVLSYDGPIIALCDIERKQIVKCRWTSKEQDGISSHQKSTLKKEKVIMIGCPSKVIMHEEKKETKFEITFEFSPE